MLLLNGVANTYSADVSPHLCPHYHQVRVCSKHKTNENVQGLHDLFVYLSSRFVDFPFLDMLSPEALHVLFCFYMSFIIQCNPYYPVFHYPECSSTYRTLMYILGFLILVLLHLYVPKNVQLILYKG